MYVMQPLIILKMQSFMDLLTKNRSTDEMSICYYFFMSLHCIHRSLLYVCLKTGMYSENTCGGLAGGRPDISAL